MAQNSGSLKAYMCFMSKFSSNINCIIKFLVVFLVLQALFVVFNIVANVLPKEIIVEHSRESVNSSLVKNAYEYDHRIFGGTVSYDNNRFILEIAEQKDLGDPFSTMTVADIVDVDKYGTKTTMQYFRYWHGWQLITNFCLLFGGIELVQIPAFLLTLVGSCLFYSAVSRKVGKLQSAIYCATLLLTTNLFFNFMGDILLSISFFTFLSLISVGFLLYEKEVISDVGLSIWTFGVGCVYSFLDFLTIPAVAAGVVATLALLICRGGILNS